VNPESLALLLDYDRRGFLLAPGETESGFLARMQESEAAFRKFEETLSSTDCSEIEVFPGISVKQSDRMAPEAPGELEAQSLTESLYGFSVRHVPIFFLSSSIGLLWGGCSLSDTESPLSLILLRDSFRARERFLFYRRTELIAHEACHAARAPLQDNDAEEFFAYQCSPSWLRRTLGNCFIHQRDAVLFLLPLLLLPVMSAVQCFLYPDFPLWIFWLLAAIYPTFLLIRNAMSLRKVRLAKANLRAAGVEKSLAVLFRCTAAECAELAKTPPEKIAAFFTERENEPRFQVIAARFLLPATVV